MNSAPNNLEQNFIDDFERILRYSPTLIKTYGQMGADEKEQLQRRWIEFVWQMILGASEARMPGAYADAMKQWGGFVVGSQMGHSVIFHAGAWVAMDRNTYNKLTAPSGSNENR